jgi:hypothetical protein
MLALINNAFVEGDKTWEQEWLSTRMRYVINAEVNILNQPGTVNLASLYHDFFPNPSECQILTAHPFLLRRYET